MTDKKLSHDFTGYLLMKRYNKKTNSVLIETFEEVGNNDGSTTANNWKLISSKWQNNNIQFKPPSDHQLHGFSNGPVNDEDKKEDE